MLSEELKKRFEQMADILEIAEENVFKIRAYRRAADVIGGVSDEILEKATAKELQKIPGIGFAIAEKTVEYRETGKIGEHEKLKQGLPEGLLDLLEIPGLGPKTLKIIWFEFQVHDIAGLKRLLESGQLEQRPHFGEKKVENLKSGIKFFEEQDERMPYAEARAKADELLSYMRKCPEVLQIEAGGSLRRKKDTIRDIDLLVATKDPLKVVDFFLASPMVHEINAKGNTKASIFTNDHRQIDLRVVSPESFGAALQYFTGSKEHNILLRKIAIKQGLHLSEYGVFRGKEKIAGETEEGVYEVLGQKWISPEERLGKDEL